MHEEVNQLCLHPDWTCNPFKNCTHTASGNKCGALGSDSERQGGKPVSRRLPGEAWGKARTDLLNAPDQGAVAGRLAQAIGLHLGRGRTPRKGGSGTGGSLGSGGGRGGASGGTGPSAPPGAAW